MKDTRNSPETKLHSGEVLGMHRNRLRHSAENRTTDVGNTTMDRQVQTGRLVASWTS
jgi:hypothetical protein